MKYVVVVSCARGDKQYVMGDKGENLTCEIKEATVYFRQDVLRIADTWKKLVRSLVVEEGGDVIVSVELIDNGNN